MGGLYSGLLPTLLRDVPEIAIQVLTRPRAPSVSPMRVSVQILMQLQRRAAQPADCSCQDGFGRYRIGSIPYAMRSSSACCQYES
jgi:hypothetical protein